VSIDYTQKKVRPINLTVKTDLDDMKNEPRRANGPFNEPQIVATRFQGHDKLNYGLLCRGPCMRGDGF